MDTSRRSLKCCTSTRPRCSATLCTPHLLNFAICVPYALDYQILMTLFRMMLIFNNHVSIFEFRRGSCHTTSVQLIMMFYVESALGAASFSNFNVISMHFSILPFTTDDVHRAIGYTVPYPLNYKGPHIPFGPRRASGNIFYDRSSMRMGTPRPSQTGVS